MPHAQKFAANLESAINWVLDPVDSPPADLPDDLPPLISDNDDETLPHPSTLGNDPPPYAPVDPKVTGTPKPPLPAPFGELRSLPLACPVPADPRTLASPNRDEKRLIDLTGEDDVPSFAPPRVVAPPSSPRTGPATKPDSDLERALKASQVQADDGDDEMAKAISMSMATLGSTEEETVGMLDSIKPEERIREPATCVVPFLWHFYELPTD